MSKKAQKAPKHLLAQGGSGTCVCVADFSFTLALDEMGTRIDDLEKNVLELMTQAGMEEQATSKWQQGHRLFAR